MFLIGTKFDSRYDCRAAYSVLKVAHLLNVIDYSQRNLLHPYEYRTFYFRTWEEAHNFAVILEGITGIEVVSRSEIAA